MFQHEGVFSRGLLVDSRSKIALYCVSIPTETDAETGAEHVRKRFITVYKHMVLFLLGFCKMVRAFRDAGVFMDKPGFARADVVFVR